MDAIQRAVPAPQVEIVEQRAARRQVFRDRPPLASRAQHIHDPVHHFAHVDVALVAAALGRRNQRLDMRPPSWRGSCSTTRSAISRTPTSVTDELFARAARALRRAPAGRADEHRSRWRTCARASTARSSMARPASARAWSAPCPSGAEATGAPARRRPRRRVRVFLAGRHRRDRRAAACGCCSPTAPGDGMTRSPASARAAARGRRRGRGRRRARRRGA